MRTSAQGPTVECHCMQACVGLSLPLLTFTSSVVTLAVSIFVLLIERNGCGRLTICAQRMCAHEAWLKELAGDDDAWDLLSFAADSFLTEQGPALIKALSVRYTCTQTLDIWLKIFRRIWSTSNTRQSHPIPSHASAGIH